MKNILTYLFVFCISVVAYGQHQNIVLLDSIKYDSGWASDVWGYVAQDGTEYALVGLRDGVSIVSLANPNNIEEVAHVEGVLNGWRDIKTWQNYAYVGNEGGDGVAIIDLSELPDSVTQIDFQPMIDNVQLETIHNIYIDEYGFLYIAGSNLNMGGVIIYDLNQNPTNPTLAGIADPTYAHDVYVRDNKMYTSDVYIGAFTIYDVADKSNIEFLARQSTPFFFTHNTWLSDDGNTIFTTDETSGAPVTAYDISDLGDIEKLAEFRPSFHSEPSSTPHNVHFFKNYLVISHYEDGIIIVDASRPKDMAEVGNYDTHLYNDGSNIQGCWGAFPYLPSGVILASDSEGELYVLMPDYVRACYFEANVTDAESGNAIVGASVEVGTIINETTDFTGACSGAYLHSGMYEVTYSHPAYFQQTAMVALINGEVAIENVALTPKLNYALSGQVLSSADNSVIEGAKVIIQGQIITYEAITDASGSFTVNVFADDTYEIYAGKWGYHTKLISVEEIDGPMIMNIVLDKGIRDEFILNFGWSVEGNASTGHWERGEPIGTGTTDSYFNPEFDLPTDLGDHCYMTGNLGGYPGTDDVDYGTTTLTSPVMDMAMMVDPYITYYTWFVNAGGQSEANDTLKVRLTDGNTEVVVETIDGFLQEWRPQSIIRVKDYFPNPTSDMQIVFEASDNGDQNWVEAAVDLFEVIEDYVGVEDVIDESIELIASPNPFNEQLTINYSLENVDENTRLEIRNALGQIVYTTSLNNKQDIHTVNQRLDVGVYFVQITNGQMISKPVKVVCTK